MKTLIGVVAGLIIGSVCTLVTQGQAKRQGCGWVLWARGNGQDWNANSGYETYTACKSRGAGLEDLFNKAATKPSDIVEFSCFPSELDPRDKK
jgi:hypothetical protein